MKDITVNELYTELIGLATIASDATLTLKIYKASDGSELAGGTFAYVAGVQWKLTFTPATLSEVYGVQVTDDSGDVVWAKSYKAVAASSSSGGGGGYSVVVDNIWTKEEKESIIKKLNKLLEVFKKLNLLQEALQESYGKETGRVLEALIKKVSQADLNYKVKDLTESIKVVEVNLKSVIESNSRSAVTAASNINEKSLDSIKEALKEIASLKESVRGIDLSGIVTGIDILKESFGKLKSDIDLSIRIGAKLLKDDDLQEILREEGIDVNTFNQGR
jgi:Asp-tRNA(Asn)/Glu-tRNA(Gln) amidotransferase C subunit